MLLCIQDLIQYYNICFKNSASCLYEMSTLPPLLCTSWTTEWKILQDASEFLAPDKFHVQFSA